MSVSSVTGGASSIRRCRAALAAFTRPPRFRRPAAPSQRIV